ncbi:S1C family serine protease [Peptoniphilus stercorisuis]|uniref:S1-C subfamily serine protease n=1 Tax=Peptoniphilus stercorisuis TaxID=1436965 RepID=A0ABS4KAN1_9FIRM|nr:trypsin-like peptidase domain-containing protein [Peptoniphilus stercorisuis]MBP2024818.1 S1-C subfamily serine protease [Peptoniphilus stercorisuis]
MADFKEDYNYDNYYGRKKKKSNKGIVILCLICAIIGGVIGSAITSVLFGGSELQSTGNSNENITINAKTENTVAAAVAKKAMPSVVGITTSEIQQSIFGAVESRGTGSGIIVDEKGYILTNTHVVKMGGKLVNSCKVLLNDGTTIEGKPIWADSSIDVAIVKVNTTEKLKSAELGDSDELQIGETAIAIGNPIDMAYQRSVTQGIISGLNRYVGQVDGGGYMTGLIQTDASINEGNSGGPLLNAKGQVIGMNTVKVSVGEGLGFSIPINSVKPIIDSVIETGDYKVVSMGTESLDVARLQRYYEKDLGVREGVFVFRVYENSPAAKSGIKDGDIIVKIGEDNISTVDSLKSTLYKYKVGDSVDMTIIRDGKEEKVNITFTDYSVADDANEDKDENFKEQKIEENRIKEKSPSDLLKEFGF